MEPRPADKAQDKAPEEKPGDGKHPNAPRPMEPGLATASPVVHQALAMADDPHTPAARQHAEAEPPQPGKALLERFALDAAKRRFTRYGSRFEIHGSTESGMVLVTKLEDSQPKNLMLMEPPTDDEYLPGPDED